MALMAQCSLDADAFAKHSLAHVLKDQLGGGDVRERYLAGMYLLQHWMLNQPHKYWQSLRQLLLHARAAGDERPLNNAYLQIESMMAAEDLADQPGGGVEDAPAHALPLREGRMA
uniref:Uncharacterized protein n=1 Tax=Chlamydomonas euryale TaxID=1486919 RepID=A0A7R9YWT5_9CHLO